MIPSQKGAKFASILLESLKNIRQSDTVKIEFEANEEFRNALCLFAEKYSKCVPIQIIEDDKEYSLNEAAEILHVSRMFVSKVLDKGEIPYRQIGSHRRIEAKELMQYKEKMWG